MRQHYLFGAHVWASFPRPILGEKGMEIYYYQGRENGISHIFKPRNKKQPSLIVPISFIERNILYFRPFLLDKRADDVENYL